MERKKGSIIRKVVLIFSSLFVLTVWLKVYVNVSKHDTEPTTTLDADFTKRSCLTFKHNTITNIIHNGENESEPRSNSENQFHKRAFNPAIYSRIQISDPKDCSTKRLLVYTCGKTKCGGLGDRVKGIVSTFLLALLTNRSLVFDVSTPCEMSNFLRHNYYNWDICLPYIRSSPKYEKLDLDFGIGDWVTFLDSKFNFQKHWNKTITYVFVDSYILDQIRRHWQFEQQLKWMKYKSNAEVIHAVFNTLFKPSLQIQHEIDYLHSNLNGKKLLCSHIRTGRASIEAGVVMYKASKTTPMFNFLLTFDPANYMIFIATDYDPVRFSALETFANIAVSRCDILHIDLKTNNTQDDNCKGMYSTLLDWFILTTCDVVFIPYSGYSCTALYPRASFEDIFIYYLDNDAIKQKRLEDLDKFCRIF